MSAPDTKPLTPGTGPVVPGVPGEKIKLGASFPVKGASLLTPVPDRRHRVARRDAQGEPELG